MPLGVADRALEAPPLLAWGAAELTVPRQPRSPFVLCVDRGARDVNPDTCDSRVVDVPRSLCRVVCVQAL